MKGKRPKPWKFPKVNKDVYKWDYSSDDDYPSEDSSDSDSSDDEYVSVKDDPNLQRQIETNGSFYGLITPGGMKRHDLPVYKPTEIVTKPVERTPTFSELNPHLQKQNMEQQVLDRLNSSSVVRGTTRGRGRGRGRGTTRGRGRGRGKRNVSVYDPDLLDPTKEVRYIDEREYDSMVGADIPND